MVKNVVNEKKLLSYFVTRWVFLQKSWNLCSLFFVKLFVFIDTLLLRKILQSQHRTQAERTKQKFLQHFYSIVAVWMCRQTCVGFFFSKQYSRVFVNRFPWRMLLFSLCFLFTFQKRLHVLWNNCSTDIYWHTVCVRMHHWCLWFRNIVKYNNNIFTKKTFF